MGDLLTYCIRTGWPCDYDDRGKCRSCGFTRSEQKGWDESPARDDQGERDG